MTRLSAAAIEAAVTGRLGRPCRFLETIDSTNAEALRWSAEGAPEGSLVAADHQTAGRGRMGRRWLSQPGDSLLFSLVLRPDGRTRRALLTTALGIACTETVRALAEVEAGLKWPNDVVIGGRKVAGILVEGRVSGDAIETAVAGIGINCRFSSQPPGEIAATATSIADETGATPDRLSLLTDFLDRFERLYERLNHPAAASHVVDRATALSVVLGRAVSVRFATGRVVDGVAERLTSDGGLIVRSGTDLVEARAGEIEHLRAGG